MREYSIKEVTRPFMESGYWIIYLATIGLKASFD
jgi:hypothetical protein